MSTKLKYGAIRNVEKLGEPLACKFSASQTLPAKSGRFVVYDTSNNLWKSCTDGENKIGGYCEDIIGGANAADAVYNVFQDISDVIFELPYATAGAAATLTQTVLDDLISLTVDLYVDGSSVQYANCSATTDALLTIVGGNVDENTVYVKVRADKIDQVA